MLDPKANTVNRLSGRPRLGSQPKPMSEPKYILGHSAAEIGRLVKQAAILQPITERLLRAAGLGSGMRVLDLGCGAGDVSFLAAELVGPSGSVIGIDRNAYAITVASERARSAGFGNIDFRQAELDAFTDDASFDCVIGRYVLVHQADPVHFLRASARLLRPQGVIAFHELDLTTSGSSSPAVPRWDAAVSLILSAFREVLPHGTAANWIRQHYLDAGLPAPSLFREIPVGAGEHSPIFGWAAEGIRSVQPQLIEMGLFPKEAIAVENIEGKIRDAVVAANSVVELPVQVGAWARI